MYITMRIYCTPRPKQEIASFVEDRFIPSIRGKTEFRGWYIVDAGEDRLVKGLRGEQRGALEPCVFTLFDERETVLEANEGSEAFRLENAEMNALLPEAPDVIVGEVMRWALPETAS